MGFDKDIKCEYFTASGVVSDTPCWLFSIMVMSSQTASKTLTVRNGSIVTARIKMKLLACVYYNVIGVFNEPIYFDKGLYLQFGTNVDNATVQYKPEY